MCEYTSIFIDVSNFVCTYVLLLILHTPNIRMYVYVDSHIHLNKHTQAHQHFSTSMLNYSYLTSGPHSSLLILMCLFLSYSFCFLVLYLVCCLPALPLHCRSINVVAIINHKRSARMAENSTHLKGKFKSIDQVMTYENENTLQKNYKVETPTRLIPCEISEQKGNCCQAELVWTLTLQYVLPYIKQVSQVQNTKDRCVPLNIYIYVRVKNIRLKRPRGVINNCNI